MHNYSKYTGIAIQMIAIIGIGTYTGVKLDALLHLTFPIFTLLFIFLSLALALYLVIKNL